MALFKNRNDAGQQLAAELLEYKNKEDLVVLGLPRGGIPVAYEIAIRLNAPLDVFVVRKLGVPGQEELGFGAIASGGVRALNKDVIATLNISNDIIDMITATEQEELDKKEKLFRGGMPSFNVNNKTTMLTDDGLATGATMRAAVNALRMHNPAKIIVAVPVASREACLSIRNNVDYMECLHTPLFFRGVSSWYNDFSQTTDSEVENFLSIAKARNL